MRGTAAAVIATIGLLAAPAVAQAAQITVTTVNDELNPADGDCSLREAVQSARDNAAFSGCPSGQAAPAVDTIRLPISTAYTLNLGDPPNPTDENLNQEGDLDLGGGDVVIRGVGRSETIVRTNLNDRIFDASIIDSTTLTLESLTVQGGNLALALAGESGGNVRLRDGGNLVVRDVAMVDGFAQTGGSIFADTGPAPDTGSVTIEDSEIEQNQAGGWGGALNAEAGMVVQVTRSTLGANTTSGTGAQLLGGAISNLTSSVDGGSMTISDSIFFNNSVVNVGGGAANAVGGAIRNRGPLTVRGSLFLENSVNSTGNDSNDQNGGAIWQESGSMTVVNSTVHDNDAGTAPADDASGGGVYVNSGSATLNHVTLLSNTAEAGGDSLATGDGDSGGLTVGRSIIPGLLGFTDPCDEGTVPIASAGFNAAVANDTGCGYVATDTTAGALGTVAGGPQANGGPTPTVAITQSGSAFNKVPAANCAPAGGADQRGYPRPLPVGGACDAGAYELHTCDGSTVLNGPFVPCAIPASPVLVPTTTPTPPRGTKTCKKAKKKRKKGKKAQAAKKKKPKGCKKKKRKRKKK